MSEIYIHASLTRFTDNQPCVNISVDTVDALIPTLCQMYPRLATSILTEEGELTPYVNCYINGENITTFAPTEKIIPNSKIDLVTALVGG